MLKKPPPQPAAPAGPDVVVDNSTDAPNAFSIVCDAKELLEVVSVAASVAPKSGCNPPCLTDLLLTIADNTLEVVGSDLAFTVRMRLHGLTKARDGTILANAQSLLNVLKGLTGDTVEVTATPSNAGCIVRSNRVHYQIFGNDVGDYPNVSVAAEGGIDLPAEVLGRMVACTRFAAAATAGRFAWNGGFFELREHTFRLVTTDSRRLALAERALEEPFGSPVNAIVPTAALDLVKDLFAPKASKRANAQQEIDYIRFGIVSKGNWAFFETKKVSLFARLVAGAYPPYEKFASVTHPTFMDLDRRDFMKSLERAKPLLKKDSMSLRFKFEKERMVMSGRGMDLGISTVEHPVSFNGEPFEARFSPDAFLDALEAWDSVKVRLEVANGQVPAVMRMLRDDGQPVPGYYYLLVPLQLD